MATTPSYYDLTKGETITAEVTSTLTTIKTMSEAGFIVGASATLNDTPTGGYDLASIHEYAVFIDNAIVFTFTFDGTDLTDLVNTKFLYTDNSSLDKNGNIAIPVANAAAIKVQAFKIDPTTGDRSTTGIDEADISISIMYP